MLEHNFLPALSDIPSDHIPWDTTQTLEYVYTKIPFVNRYEMSPTDLFPIILKRKNLMRSGMEKEKLIATKT